MLATDAVAVQLWKRAGVGGESAGKHGRVVSAAKSGRRLEYLAPAELKL